MSLRDITFILAFHSGYSSIMRIEPGAARFVQVREISEDGVDHAYKLSVSVYYAAEQQKQYGGGHREEHGVYAVEYATVARNQVSGVLGPHAALHHGLEQVAERGRLYPR